LKRIFSICLFFLGFKASSSQTEERGCLADFLAIMGVKNIDTDNPNNGNDDVCQKTNDGTSLCKCAYDFCNSSTRNSYSLSSLVFVSLLNFFGREYCHSK
jgi:hypothetical protein